MNLTELQKLGAFVSKEPVKKSVTWVRKGEDGADLSDTFDVHIKRRSYGDLERFLLVDEADERSKTARFISESILLGEGDAQTSFSYEQAYQLEVSLALVLMEAANDVNGKVNAEKK